MSNQNDSKDAQGMSLSELLGQQEAPSAPEQEEGEKGSGLINMAALVSQVAPAKTPAPAPSSADPFGTPAPASAQPVPAAPPTVDAAAMPAAQPAPKKKVGLIVGLAAGVVVASAVAVWFTTQSRQDTSQQELAALEKELQMLKAAAASEQDAAKRKELEAKIAQQQEQLDQANQANQGADTAASEGEETSMEFEMEETVDATGKRRVVRRKRRRAAAQKDAAAADAPSEAKAAEKPAGDNTQSKQLDNLLAQKAQKPAEKKEAPKSKTAALDSLLNSGKAVKTDGLQQTPTRAQVQQVMSRVAAKARGVCKGAGQTVRIRVIVSSNGRVRDAIPQGEHAADTLGRCVATFARRTAVFPAFAKPTFTFTYPLKM